MWKQATPERRSQHHHIGTISLVLYRPCGPGLERHLEHVKEITISGPSLLREWRARGGCHVELRAVHGDLPLRCVRLHERHSVAISERGGQPNIGRTLG